MVLVLSHVEDEPRQRHSLRRLQQRMEEVVVLLPMEQRMDEHRIKHVIHSHVRIPLLVDEVYLQMLQHLQQQHILRHGMDQYIHLVLAGDNLKQLVTTIVILTIHGMDQVVQRVIILLPSMEMVIPQDLCQLRQ